jgi:hypothetical protein
MWLRCTKLEVPGGQEVPGPGSMLEVPGGQH